MRVFLISAGLFWAISQAGAETALTIYNQNFGVVRGQVLLDLQKGENDVQVQDVTSQLEPDSVILRDPSEKRPLQILEQSYRNDPVTQGLLLSLNEGKTIDFVVKATDKPDQVVKGKIIRSAYLSPTPPPAPGRYYPQVNTTEPIIEVDGTLRFGLPGLPIFPSLGDETILKPQLSWKLQAKEAGKVEAELSYITGGMTWEADYNIVATTDDVLDLVGWVTMSNKSGKAFSDAKVKLVAGEVSKLQAAEDAKMSFDGSWAMAKAGQAQPAVTEKAFDEYHLYTLARPLTLRDGETKQVEFVRATGIKSQKIYVYDGLKLDWTRWRGYPRTELRRNEEFGTESDTKVAVMREFKNSEANQLGMPLPAGRIRFYQQDEDKQLEFIGENQIDHTPKDETVRVTTGNAFDLVGERQRTDFKVDNSNDWAEEAFEIKLRNHKKEEVEIRVVEHLFRWVNWDVTEKSNTFLKVNAQEIEFRVQLKPDEEKVIAYRVKYTW